jgi:hypothetical protein
MSAKKDSTKQANALNIHLMLTSHEKIFRNLLIDKLIEEKRPIFSEEIEFEEKELILKGLTDKGLIVTGENRGISGLYPVSAAPNRHKVQLEDGRSLYAMCAIDSLGIAYEFNQNIAISSSCSQCNSAISVVVIDGKISLLKPLTAHVLHRPLSEYKNWATTC